MPKKSAPAAAPPALKKQYAPRVEFTPELRAEFCERIAGGETVREIVADRHMPSEKSIYLALAADEAFAAQYGQAREAQLVGWEDEILRIADDATNDYVTRKRGDEEVVTVDHDHINRSRLRIDARKWLMAKRLPKRYGERVSTEVSGPGGAPIAVENVSDRDVAMRVAFLLQKGMRDA